MIETPTITTAMIEALRVPTSFRNYSNVFDSLYGKYIEENGTALDIGSGGSNLVSLLSQRGVQAIGVDPRYFSYDEEGRAIHQSYADQMTSPWIDLLEAEKSAYRDFCEDKIGSYVAGSVDGLPFQDSSFNMVFEGFFLRRHAMRDNELPDIEAEFSRATTAKRYMSEALRVLKPGGYFVSVEYSSIFPIRESSLIVNNRVQHMVMGPLLEDGTIRYVDQSEVDTGDEYTSFMTVFQKNNP